MEFLKAQLSRVQEQFSQLTASQKMLAAALMVITLMTLYWWTNFAGKADMEVLFDQPMAADQIGSAITQLQGAGIEAQAVGDRLHVAADKKLQAIGLLSSTMQLPGDTKNAIDELVGKINPWMSHSLEDRMFLHAKQTVLAQTLRYWPQIRHAVVIIDPTRDRGPNGTEPSASVSVMLKPNAVADQRLAESIGDFISGTFSSLHRSRIKVHINDRSFNLRDKDDQSPTASAEDLLAQLQSYENHFSKKIKEQFRYIDGVFVTVTCRVNNERTEKNVETIDLKGIASKPVHESSQTEENNSRNGGAGEAGVVPNQGLSVENAGGGDKSSNTTEKTQTDYAVAFPKSIIRTVNNGGDSTPLGVSVLFPRSRFVQEYKQIKNSDKEPEPAALQTFIDEQLRLKRAIVKGCVGGLPDESVTVADYADSLPVTSGATLAAAAPMSLMLTDHAKEIALGALALVSLFMVSNMVRKGSATPAPAMAMAGGGIAPRGAVPLQGREEAVGEAMEGDTLLDGMELDEESAKAQQMLNQVSALVEENPDAAANLVKRWMNRS